jgi:hypothetical protein
MRGEVSVVQGEVSQLLSAMRKTGRWSGHARTVSPTPYTVFYTPNTCTKRVNLTSVEPYLTYWHGMMIPVRRCSVPGRGTRPISTRPAQTPDGTERDP